MVVMTFARILETLTIFVRFEALGGSSGSTGANHLGPLSWGIPFARETATQVQAVQSDQFTWVHARVLLYCLRIGQHGLGSTSYGATPFGSMRFLSFAAMVDQAVQSVQVWIKRLKVQP